MLRTPSLLLVGLVFSACNLPNDADDARGRLADRSESTAALTVPFPAVQFEPGDYLAGGDGHLNRILDSSGESIRYPTNWREVDVTSGVSSFDQKFPVHASDFGPGFAAILDLIRIPNVAVQLEIENTGDVAVSYQGVELALHDASGRVVERAVPAQSAKAGTVPAKSTQAVEIPVTTLANLLRNEIAAGRDLNIAVKVDELGIKGGTASLRTRAIVQGPIVIELGSREVRFRHVMHEKFDGDEEILRDLQSLKVDSAWLELHVVNALPIALRADIAIAPTPENATGFDPLTAPERVQLTTVQIDAARARPDGTVTARAVTNLSIPLSAATVNLLRSGVVSFGGDFTISATADRVKIGPDNSFEVKASARLRVKHKGR